MGEGIQTLDFNLGKFISGYVKEYPNREVKISYLDVSVSMAKSINSGAMVVPKTFGVLASFEKLLN